MSEQQQPQQQQQQQQQPSLLQQSKTDMQIVLDILDAVDQSNIAKNSAENSRGSSGGE